MAKKAKKKTSRPSKRPNDATNIAALHWYALMIERISIQLYVTDARNLGDIKTVLDDALKGLNHVRKDFAAPCGECPDGWECCKADNLCAPTCIDES